MSILDGLNAVITGASGGLGMHFARLLAEHGAGVAITARRPGHVAALADALCAEGHRAVGLELDVANAAAIGPAFDVIEAALGPVSIVVNNAGISAEGAALDLSVDDWDAAFAVNVRGTFLVAREGARRMIASGTAAAGTARVVNIASIASSNVLPGLPAYCTSKAAVAMLTRSLGHEWARRGIAVNAICPGYIATDINDAWFESEGGARQIRGFPRRRLMEAGDLDAALLLLAGPAARTITGTLITVDDGQSLVGG